MVLLYKLDKFSPQNKKAQNPTYICGRHKGIIGGAVTDGPWSCDVWVGVQVKQEVAGGSCHEPLVRVLHVVSHLQQVL